MSIIIRNGLVGDVPAALGLIKELAEYEKAAEEVQTTVESMQQDGFGGHPFFEFMVAELEGKIVGIAVYFFSYSTWKGRAIYLDDLIVTESCRQMGIGRKLFDAVVHRAQTVGAKRMNWQVLDWNEPAIAFYNKLKADLDPTWINCKLTAEQIENFQFETEG